MNPSQKPAQPQHPRPPAGPAADADIYRPSGHQPGELAQDGWQAAPGEAAGAGRADAHDPVVGYPAEAYGPELYDLPDGEYPRSWARGSARRPGRRTASVAVASALVIFLLGAPLGLLWHWLAPSVPVIDTANGIVVNDPSPEEYIAADGWFTLLGLGFGLLMPVVAWLVLRRDRGPFLLLGVVIGMLGAGYLTAPWVGSMIGRAGYQHWRETAVPGATYLAPPEVHSVGPLLVPAFAAAVVLTLLAGWSNDPDLDEPGARPGYGPNLAAAEADGDAVPGYEAAGGDGYGPDVPGESDPTRRQA